MRISRLIPRLVRRAWHRSRVAHHEHELRVLNAERDTFERRLGVVLRDLRQAREDLFFLDAHRPPITHAPGRPRAMTTGVVRQVSGLPPEFLLAKPATRLRRGRGLRPTRIVGEAR